MAWGTSVSRRCCGRILAFVALAVPFGPSGPLLPCQFDSGDAVLTGRRISEPACDRARSTTGPRRPQEAGPDLPTEALGFEPVTIPGVPRHLWRDGCGPTAAGMVIGYWEGRGFDDLVVGAAGGDRLRAEFAVSAPGGFRGGNGSWNRHVDDALLGHARRANPAYDPAYARVYHLAADPDRLWFALVREVDAGHPAVFLVDSNGDGEADHFVTVIGYDSNHNYGLLDTWDTEDHWQPLAPIRAGTKWGVYAAHFFTMDRFDWQPGVLEVRGSLDWAGVEPGATVSGTLEIVNRGGPGSGLFWRVAALPDWGIWEWDPAEGLNLGPEEGVEHLTVSVIAPTRPGESYRGSLVLVNAERPGERFEVEVSLATGPRAPMGPSLSARSR